MIRCSSCNALLYALGYIPSQMRLRSVFLRCNRREDHNNSTTWRLFSPNCDVFNEENDPWRIWQLSVEQCHHLRTDLCKTIVKFESIKCYLKARRRAFAYLRSPCYVRVPIGGIRVKTRVRGLREAAKGDFIQLDVLKYRLVPRRNIHFAVHAGVLGRLN